MECDLFGVQARKLASVASHYDVTILYDDYTHTGITR